MEVMMPYIFCTLVNLAKVSAIICLGWCILKGATAWLIIAMIVLCLSIVIPSRDIFTCPACGHIAEVKVYKVGTGQNAGVQKEPGDTHD